MILTGDHMIAGFFFAEVHFHAQSCYNCDIKLNERKSFMDKTAVYAEHLSGMVQFPTLSNTDESKVDYDVFYRFHEYLEKTYPLVHKTFEKKVIGKASLLYKWASENPAEGKLPVLLMAHQDVVPEGDHAQWKFPPYSGTIEGSVVHGRGSGDCKANILSELETLEALIAEGFKADYDIYLAFGHNEEIMVPEDRKGARLVAEYLEKQGVRLGAVFDEGGGPEKIKTDAYEGYMITLFAGEKGFHDYEIYKDCKGGHSMAPGSGTALGQVAKAVVNLEANLFPYRLTDLTRASLKAQSVLYSGKKKEAYADPDHHMDELAEFAKEDLFLDATLRTTLAVTMAQGSGQSNILPTHASVTVNSRVLSGDTGESVQAYIQSLCPEGVQVRHIAGEGPYPDGRTDGPVVELIGEVEEEILGEKPVIIPSLLPGGTDAKCYTGICDNVFRYTGTIKNGVGGGAHGFNESFDTATTQSSVDFFTGFLKKY